MAAFRPCAASLRLSLSAIKLDANPDRDEDGKAVLNPGTKLDRYSRVSEREAEGGRGSTNAGGNQRRSFQPAEVDGQGDGSGCNTLETLDTLESPGVPWLDMLRHGC
jgi:hypothetical protein